MNKKSEPKMAKMFVVRIVLIAVILIAGGILFVGLVLMKEAPKAIEVPEPVITVEVQTAQKEQVPVVITGYGQARALNSVSVAAEVPGMVVEIHPRLEVGEVIPQGEVLCKIDDRDYKARFEQAQAQVVQAENALARIKSQYQQDSGRLETIRRSRNLALSDFERVKNLFEQDEVGTRSGVERAEMGYNEAEDAFDRINQAVTLYPNLIHEAEGALAAAHAQRDMAAANLDRTTLVAPFDARIKMVNLEQGQYLRLGDPVMTLADDSVLEISVPIDSRDARSWLAFETETQKGQSWFGEVKPVECDIRWTEDKEKHVWKGILHRVESFDQTSRTVSLAVRVDAHSMQEDTASLPLVEGMFCEVSITGKEMKDVVRLPRWAVTYEGFAYVANADRRLEKRAVEVLRTQGEEAFVSSGLDEGDTIIVTRLQNPMPNTRLNIRDADSAGEKSMSALSAEAVQ